MDQAKERDRVIGGIRIIGPFEECLGRLIEMIRVQVTADLVGAKSGVNINHHSALFNWFIWKSTTEPAVIRCFRERDGNLLYSSSIDDQAFVTPDCEEEVFRALPDLKETLKGHPRIQECWQPLYDAVVQAAEECLPSRTSETVG